MIFFFFLEFSFHKPSVSKFIHISPHPRQLFFHSIHTLITRHRHTSIFFTISSFYPCFSSDTNETTDDHIQKEKKVKENRVLKSLMQHRDHSIKYHTVTRHDILNQVQSESKVMTAATRGQWNGFDVWRSMRSFYHPHMSMEYNYTNWAAP